MKIYLVFMSLSLVTIFQATCRVRVIPYKLYIYDIYYFCRRKQRKIYLVFMSLNLIITTSFTWL